MWRCVPVWRCTTLKATERLDTSKICDVHLTKRWPLLIFTTQTFGCTFNQHLTFPLFFPITQLTTLNLWTTWDCLFENIILIQVARRSERLLRLIVLLKHGYRESLKTYKKWCKKCFMIPVFLFWKINLMSQPSCSLLIIRFQWRIRKCLVADCFQWHSRVPLVTTFCSTSVWSILQHFFALLNVSICDLDTAFALHKTKWSTFLGYDLVSAPNHSCFYWNIVRALII